ncbi:MAG: NAD+ synthase [Candidatus Omnitrophica bacterium]|nr:NAD+ synthase [Candidatus Omnitrophota bacterium]MDD5487561.1 NAD+ synthase [Candidatus Omnitrophota bacterium]
MRITMAQLNPTVGDVDSSVESIRGVMAKYANETDLVVFPELFICGYPPRDLLEKRSFRGRIKRALAQIFEISAGYPTTGMIVGAPTENKDGGLNGLYNSAVFVCAGKVIGVANKRLLPVYDVFDERRYFDTSGDPDVIEFKGERIGVTICEDMWNIPGAWSGKRYTDDPVAELAKKGATMIVNISASPFCDGKEKARCDIISAHARNNGIPFVFVNQVGGNDELVFDGRSMFFGSDGVPAEVLPAFEEKVLTIDTGTEKRIIRYIPQDKMLAVKNALVLGIRDYMRKCGFQKAVIGLSGGIDSAVTCALAAEAIGSSNVTAVTMPSGYSSPESEAYSRKLAENLGIDLRIIPIKDIYNDYICLLDKEIDRLGTEDVEVYMQNIQARIRGNILMAFSNRYGWLLLTTGNKSEMAVGYCTLYGDMAGGLAVISDVPKTMVYGLAAQINRAGEVIPREIIERVPSAELKPGQTDQDTLPEYGVLDDILALYLEEGYPASEIAEKGYDPGTVKWVIEAVRKNEYKRKQAPPGLKVTTKAFGTGRRMPIAARYGH